MNFDKTFFGLTHDLFVCVVYYTPAQSLYAQNMGYDIFQLLERDIVNYQSGGENFFVVISMQGQGSYLIL